MHKAMRSFNNAVLLVPFANTKKFHTFIWPLLKMGIRATFNQILHLRDWSRFVALFSDLRYCLCRGFIALENKTFIIEPVPGHDNGTHIIYRVEELRLTPGDCGHGFNMSSVAPENQIKNPFQSFHTRVR